MNYVKRKIIQTKKLRKNKFFNDLKKSLEEVLAYKKGKLKLYSEEIELPILMRRPSSF